MSIIIVKVDREHNTHSIWSDGQRTTSDSDIFDTSGTKIRHLESEKYDVLIGCVGSTLYGNYVRMRFMDKLVESDINDFEDEDLVTDKLREIFQELWKEFCDGNGINYKYDGTCDSILSINGHIFLAETYTKDQILDVSMVTGYDYAAIGQDANAANIMLDVGMKPDDIIRAISKRNVYVNENVKAILNIKIKQYEGNTN